MLLQLLRKYLRLSDEELVKKFQSSNDSYYVGVLFERYNEMTVSLALNYLKNEADAEDAVMECFEVLYKELPKAKIKNFGGWYYSVVRNYLLKVKRNRSKNTNDELVEGYTDKADEDIFNQLFDDRESTILTLVEEVLDELKPMQKKCVKAFYMENKKYKEIAKQFSLTEKEVKSNLQNGKRKLIVELEKRNVRSVNEIS